MSGTTSIRASFRLATPALLFTLLVYSMGELAFGLDSAMFGTLQVVPSWLRQFGELKNGKYVLTSERKSIMSSVQWIGKILGTMIVEPLVDRVGFKRSMIVVVVLQVIGCLMEICATEWILFSSGRVIVYLTIGLIENLVPSYGAEMAPAPLRGFTVMLLLQFLGIGVILAAVIVNATASMPSKAGWMIPVGLQFLPTVILGGLLPFTCESPRWLLSKGRREEAIQVLNKVRRKDQVASGETEQEAQMIQVAIEQAKEMTEGTWLDLFRGTNFRRTMVATWMFIFQQWNGQQFINAYGPTFYVQMGLGSMAFVYTIINGVVGQVMGIGFSFVLDKIGRRRQLIGGIIMATIFMFLVAILGSRPSPSKASVNMVVASIILFRGFSGISLNACSFIIGAEIGSIRLRKKTLAFATFIDVLAAFAATYSGPYLLSKPGLNLGPRVGYVFGGISFASLFFVVFYVPELAKRSLEEIDELFERKLWAWQFAKAKTSGVASEPVEEQNVEPMEKDVDMKESYVEHNEYTKRV